MKILWVIVLLLTTGCKPVVHSGAMNTEIKTFYSGLLNGEDISVTRYDRDYKTKFFKENNKNFHKKEFSEVDRYVKENNIDIAYTAKSDTKISRWYRGNTKVNNSDVKEVNGVSNVSVDSSSAPQEYDNMLKYYLVISAPLDNLQVPHVEKSIIKYKDDKQTKLETRITVDNSIYDVEIVDSQTSKIYKQFKYSFENESRSN